MKKTVNILQNRVILVVVLLALTPSVFAQTQLAIWDFASVSNASNDPIDATTNAVPGTPSLMQYYQDIDDNGKGGTSYTDVNSVAHSAGSAIAWDDIKGDGTDAELVITMSTTGWEDISLRFNYKSESSESFDLRYSLNNGASWILVADDSPITEDGFNSWSAKTINLSSFSPIENQPSVLFKISELDNTGNDKFAFDNIEFYGTQIVVIPGQPSIQAHVSTTGFLNNNTYSGSASGVINDPTDPCRYLGLNFLLRDSNTPLNTLNVTATSSNSVVVPNANLTLTTINDSIRNLKINPTGVGYANITITVSDGNSSDSYVLNYASSAIAYSPANTNFHTGIADGSTSIDVGNNFIIAADDETNSLLLYNKDSSGYYLNAFNIGTPMGIPEEGDFEASFRKGNRAYWISSLGNSSSGNIKPSRHRFFATDVVGSGSTATTSFVGSYDMRAAIIPWGDAHNYDFTSSAEDGMIPKQIDGLNVEGMCLGPNNTSLYIAFRAPLVPMSNRTNALICPVLNFETWFNNGNPSGTPTFGNPIELNLGGRGIREISKNANGQFLIIAGSYDDTQNFALYEWDGNPTSQPVLLTADLTTLHPEGIVSFPSPFFNGSEVELMCDDGTNVYYADGIQNKLLSDANNKKFRTVKVGTTGGILQPCIQPVVTSFTTPDADICVGQSTSLVINGSLNNAVNWKVYEGGCGNTLVSTTTNSTVIVSPTTTTTYYIRGEGGCVTPSSCITVTVNVNQLPAVTAQASDNTLCAGDQVTLNGGGAITYTWNNNVTNNVAFTPNQTNTYTVTGVDANGCENTANVLVAVNNLPVVTAQASDNTLCAGDQVTLNGGGAITYTWNNNVTNNVAFTPNQTNTYTVTGIDGNGCENTANVLVAVNNLPAVTANATTDTVCSGSSVTLTGGGALTYLWNNSITNGLAFQPTQTNTYTVTGTDVNGCQNTAQQTVVVNSLPAVGIVLSPGSTVCNGTMVTLTGSGANSYTWTGGISNNTPFSAENTNTYTVTGTNAAGCSNTNSITVTVNSLPVVTANASATLLCVNYPSATLTGTPTGGTWSGSGVSGTTFNPQTAGIGTHQAIYSYTDNLSCTNTDTVVITVNACTGVFENEAEPGFSIYPNPNNGSFTLAANTTIGNIAIEILDIQGRLVYKGIENNIQPGFTSQISLDTVVNGLYVLRIIGNNIYQTNKLIIQR